MRAFTLRTRSADYVGGPVMAVLQPSSGPDFLPRCDRTHHVAPPSSPAAARAARYLADPRRRTMVVVAVLATIGLIVFGIYATLDGPPPQQEAVVYFAPGATEAQKDAVRAACPSVGRAIQLPKDRNQLATSRIYPLRYDVAKASTADRAALYKCVYAQPHVLGINQVTQGQ
ncbi:hypothetical protein KBI5_17445 [Frankia sp. KB5]|uniref:Uncharacterized protein n=2 Tax=Frankia TaxID=1854 RepID=Q2JBS6_FRACC|nr:hypothetical protein Francci3_1890 [Frankia casuarinae]OFB40845.1 hypothetical protein Manayef4_18215 [Frankia sp. CgIM4]OHV50996.1 hypothetical protein CgIS1_19925 [Frankia sp. CgIS1]ORT47862.1 hypothetical protein KBI5_17445 [Frankia sp. KB5]